MKKLFLIILAAILCSSLYAKSYEEYLAEGKNYEASGKLCHALVSYYDAAALKIPVEQKIEAYECYKKLSELIQSGKITENETDEAEFHKIWKNLVDDANKFKKEFPKYEIVLRGVERDPIIHEKKNVTYQVAISYKEQKKYSPIMETISTGYDSAKKRDWRDINWDADSGYCSEIEDYSILIVASDCEGNKLFEKVKYLRKGDYSRNEYYLSYLFSDIPLQQIDLIHDFEIKEYHFNGYVYSYDETIKNILNETEFAEYYEEQKRLEAERKEIERLLKLVEENKIKLTDNQFKEIPGKNIKMLQTEVTQELYEAVMGENPSHYKGTDLPVERVSWYDAVYFCNLLSYAYGLEPVYTVYSVSMPISWDYTPHKEHSMASSLEGMVKQNLNANGFRLPTVEEWQYAARGGQDFTYSGSNNLDEVAWYEKNGEKKTHPVAQKKANGYGLYDMSGNVWEWCWDLFPNWTIRRHCCGGSYSSDEYCEVSKKSDDPANEQYVNIGFRIVCSGK